MSIRFNIRGSRLSCFKSIVIDKQSHACIDSVLNDECHAQSFRPSLKFASIRLVFHGGSRMFSLERVLAVNLTIENLFGPLLLEMDP